MKQAVCSLRHLSQLPLLGERGPRLESNSQNFCPKSATVLYHVPLPQCDKHMARCALRAAPGGEAAPTGRGGVKGVERGRRRACRWKGLRLGPCLYS